MARLNITVPDELYERIEKWRERLNLSRICQDAIGREIDKLELVLATMQAQGVPTQNVRVLSGFRAPYYNAGLVAEGAARSSHAGWI